MEIKLNEFYNRINSIFDNTSEQVSIIELKDIESVLSNTYKNISYNIYYYDEDLSLSEIAENEGITRQGVRDAIKRAENQLFDMENRLGLAKRFNEVKQCLAEIKECAEEISDYNLNHTLSKEISSNAAKIKALADMLGE